MRGSLPKLNNSDRSSLSRRMTTSEQLRRCAVEVQTGRGFAGERAAAVRFKLRWWGGMGGGGGGTMVRSLRVEVPGIRTPSFSGWQGQLPCKAAANC